MSDDRLDSTAQYRAIKAVVVVMVLLLMVPGIDVLFDRVRESQGQSSFSGGIDSSLIMRQGDPFAALDQIEELASASSEEVSEAMLEEIGILPGAEDVRGDATGSVLGYVVAGDAGETAERLREHMESLGWKSVALGGVKGATFVKSGGAYTWVLATCTQVGQSTSVVVRCMGS